MSNEQLKGALKAATLHPLLLMVSKVLARSGYGEIRVMDRRTARQKSRDGGHELICELLQGQEPHRIVVKVLRDSIRIRNLDELVGTINRTGADSGLVVSAHHITRDARRLIESYSGVEIGVVDGDGLANWLRVHGIGVLSNGDVDYGFFGHLEDLSHHVRRFLDQLTDE